MHLPSRSVKKKNKSGNSPWCQHKRTTYPSGLSPRVPLLKDIPALADEMVTVSTAGGLLSQVKQTRR